LRLRGSGGGVATSRSKVKSLIETFLPRSGGNVAKRSER
jgi:hypothetical protein